MTIKRWMAIPAVLFASVIPACYHHGDADDEPTPAQLTQILVSPDPLTVEIGDTAVFTATGVYSDGTSAPLAVSWWSTDSNVALSQQWAQNLSMTGSFYAVGLGTAQIMVSLPDNPALSIGAITTLTVVVQPAPEPTIVTTLLFGGFEGSAYSEALQYVNGSGAALWEIVAGALPLGISLDPATGVLSGTLPTPGGSWPFTVRITDAAGSDTQDLTLWVEAPPQPLPPH